MPDITMCSNRDCPLAELCYRKQATPNEFWQSYFEPKSLGHDCGYYMPVVKADSANCGRQEPNKTTKQVDG